tara:strand:+ start:169 stop:384 length:216 start_codon:yes stop_codon:yes gene_type:complete
MYNGHKNKNHWNVSLWLFNDESNYKMVMSAVREQRTLDLAARYLLMTLPKKTMDGAPYTFASVRAALRGVK